MRNKKIGTHKKRNKKKILLSISKCSHDYAGTVGGDTISNMTMKNDKRINMWTIDKMDLSKSLLAVWFVELEWVNSCDTRSPSAFI